MPKIATSDVIRDGFIKSGMIDASSLMSPDLFAILNTTRRALSNEEIENCKQAFPTLLAHFRENGHVSDEQLEANGLPMDTNIRGEKVRRTATIQNEVCQRAKCFSHPAQKSLRAKREAEFQAKADESKHQKEMEQRQLRVWNRECEDQIREKLADGTTLSTAPLKLFATPYSRHLSSFICARDASITKSKLPKKGKLEEAAHGESTLIKMAFDLRDHPVCDDWNIAVSENTPHQAQTSYQEEQVPLLDVPHRALVVKIHSSMEECEFTITREWLDNVRVALDPLDATNWADIGEFDSGILQQNATNLYIALWSRLEFHLRSRVKDISKRNHWVWNCFVRENLAVVAGIMVYAKHVIKNPENAVSRSKQCLLSNPFTSNNFLELNKTEASEKLEGCYLFFDPNQGIWIRSGKVNGRPFSTRLLEHSKEARLTDSKSLESRFYCQYPSTTTDKKCKSRLGTHEELRAYCALGFPTTKHESWKILERTGQDSLLQWSGSVIRNVDRSFGKLSNFGEKQRQMTGYFFEVCYELALSPYFDISDGPGFEVFMMTRTK